MRPPPARKGGRPRTFLPAAERRRPNTPSTIPCALQAVEDAYRAALAGTAPELLKKATDRELQLFVEEMFDLLTGSLNGRPDRGPATFSRQDILEIIAALILNAMPGTKESACWRRGARGIRLWATLISLIPEYVGMTMEKTSIRWPAALRRRFLSALY